MAWTYAFKDLSDGEKLLRRQKLGSAGHTTVVSQLGILAIISVYRFLRKHLESRGNSAGFLTRLKWRLSMPILWSLPELRSPGDWLVVGGWTSWMMLLAARDAGDDYLHLTKAFGIIAAANLPMLFLLSMKCTPLELFFEVSHEGHLNFLHQWLGRVIYLLLSLHAGLYLNFFWETSRMKTRLLEFDILCGVAGMLMLTTIVTAAHPYVRAWSYKLFYLIHISTASLLFPTLYLHVSHLRPYLLISLAIFSYDRLRRKLTAQEALAVVHSPSQGLIELQLLPSHPKRVIKYAKLLPGGHAFLTVPSISPWTSNPFTLVSDTIREGRKTTTPSPPRIIVRVQKGQTTHLAARVPKNEPIPVVLDMTYGMSLFFPPLETSFDKILFVAGGVGAAFAVPWVNYLLNSRNEAGERIVKDGQVRFIWAIRKPSDLSWAFSSPSSGDKAIADLVEVYITHTLSRSTPSSSSSSSSSISSSIELQPIANTTSTHTNETLRALTHLPTFQRPNLELLVDEVIKQSGNHGRVAVLVCGPAGMARDLKKAVGRWVLGAKRDVWLHVEEFGY